MLLGFIFANSCTSGALVNGCSLVEILAHPFVLFWIINVSPDFTSNLKKYVLASDSIFTVLSTQISPKSSFSEPVSVFSEAMSVLFCSICCACSSVAPGCTGFSLRYLFTAFSISSGVSPLMPFWHKSYKYFSTRVIGSGIFPV